jgi:tetratricopeptide (TPR) repeat protein
MFFPIDYNMFSPLDYLASPLYIILGIGFIGLFLFALFLSKRSPEIITPLSLMFVFISGHLLLLFTVLYPYKVYARYMMIPILGLCWIFAVFMRPVKDKWKLTTVSILVLIFIPYSILNATVFKNETRYFLKGLSNFPSDSYLLFQTAKAFYDSEDYLSSELYLRQTLALPTPEDTATLIQILYSDLDFRRTKYDSVFEWLRKIEGLALSQHSQLDPLLRYQISWKRILVSIYKGETEAAEDLLRENIQTYPDRIESYFELHRLYISYRQWDEARRVEEMVRARFQSTQGLDTGRIQSEFNSFSRSEKIAFYIQNRNFEAAIEAINTLEAIDLEHKILLVKLSYWKGDEAGGLEIVRDILRERPENHDVHNRIGLLYLQDLVRVEEALAHFNKSLDLNPSQPKLRSMTRRLNEEYLKKLEAIKIENGT